MRIKAGHGSGPGGSAVPTGLSRQLLQQARSDVAANPAARQLLGEPVKCKDYFKCVRLSDSTHSHMHVRAHTHTLTQTHASQQVFGFDSLTWVFWFEMKFDCGCPLNRYKGNTRINTQITRLSGKFSFDVAGPQADGFVDVYVHFLLLLLLLLLLPWLCGTSVLA